MIMSTWITNRKCKQYDLVCVADFETTVWTKKKLKELKLKTQPETEVWAAGIAVCFSDDSFIFNCIEDFLECALKLSENTLMYFHNLKFDGCFIIDYILKNGFQWTDHKGHLLTGEFKCLIGTQGKFYSITICTAYGYLTIYDSVKLLPFSVEEIGKGFDTKHKKLSIVYEGDRCAHQQISLQDELYLRNDLLVPKEAIELMYQRGHTSMTIGGCCMKEFHRSLKVYEYRELFPNLGSVKFADLDMSVDDFCRRTYHGAWCFCLRPGRHGYGRTYDINSEYSFVMHSSSGFRYPVGMPKFFKGNIPLEATENNRIFFVHIRCRFLLKKGFLPTIQIKNSTLYKSTEWLFSSDFYVRGKYYSEITKSDGTVIQAIPDLYLTQYDYELLLKHYDITDLEIIEGCYFATEIGLFDDYIDFYMNLKRNAKTKSERCLAKLFLNNLYGKFATNDDATYLEPFLIDGVLNFEPHNATNIKKLQYIPVGSMIISYARYYTITHAQENYEHFVYADTDSLHLLECEPKNLEIHPSKLGAWKCEREWSSGIFLRQKCYAEFERKHDGEKVYPHWEITCAGMPERCKRLFLATHPITDFKPGLSIGGKLVPKHVKGGIVLEETTYTFRDNKYLERKNQKAVDLLIEKCYNNSRHFEAQTVK